MSKPLVSVVVPGVRTDNWENLYDSIGKAIKRHSYEVIFVGPHFPPGVLQDKWNVKYIRDFGCVSRAFQLGTVVAEGTLFLWAVDDGYLLEDSLDGEIDKLLMLPWKDVINLRYTEGDGYKWNGDERINNPQHWYAPHTHDALRLPGIKAEWWTAPLFMMYLGYFRELGGLDCRFEHANLNLPDLMFRIQRDGGKLHFSDTIYHRLEVQFNRDASNCPILNAYVNNDLPLLNAIYSTVESSENRPIRTDYDNWRNAESVWTRKWGQVGS